VWFVDGTLRWIGWVLVACPLGRGSLGAIAQDDHGRSLFLPHVPDGRWDGSRHPDEGTKHQIDVAVAVEIPGIEGEPATGDGLAEGGGLEFEFVASAGVFEVEESFAGGSFVVGKERDRGDVEVAIEIEVAGDGPIA
jgi:hypothetical protein